MNQDHDVQVDQRTLVLRGQFEEACVSEDGSVLVDGDDVRLMRVRLQENLVKGTVDLLEAPLIFLP